MIPFLWTATSFIVILKVSDDFFAFMQITTRIDSHSVKLEKYYYCLVYDRSVAFHHSWHPNITNLPPRTLYHTGERKISLQVNLESKATDLPIFILLRQTFPDEVADESEMYNVSAVRVEKDTNFRKEGRHVSQFSFHRSCITNRLVGR